MKVSFVKYSGYNDGVYNPNALVSLMLEGDFQSYWSGTASYSAIGPLINMDFDGLRTANKDDVLTYLNHLGYLAYQRKSNFAFVPNEEIRQELIRSQCIL